MAWCARCWSAAGPFMPHGRRRLEIGDLDSRAYNQPVCGRMTECKTTHLRCQHGTRWYRCSDCWPLERIAADPPSPDDGDDTGWRLARLWGLSPRPVLSGRIDVGTHPSPLVAGAGHTGTTLVTDGWSAPRRRHHG